MKARHNRAILSPYNPPGEEWEDCACYRDQKSDSVDDAACLGFICLAGPDQAREADDKAGQESDRHESVIRDLMFNYRCECNKNGDVD